VATVLRQAAELVRVRVEIADSPTYDIPNAGAWATIRFSGIADRQASYDVTVWWQPASYADDPDMDLYARALTDLIRRHPGMVANSPIDAFRRDSPTAEDDDVPDWDGIEVSVADVAILG